MYSKSSDALEKSNRDQGQGKCKFYTFQEDASKTDGRNCLQQYILAE